jgi:hypothetical protein
MARATRSRGVEILSIPATTIATKGPDDGIAQRNPVSDNVSVVHDVPEPLAAQACPRLSLPNMSWNYLRGSCVKWRVS